MVNDRLEAEDVLQRSFVDVFTKIGSFRFESSIGAWIKRIVVNNCINATRKKGIRAVELDEEHLRIPTDNSQEPELPDYLSINHVKNAIAQLPDGYRIVLTLYLFEGMDHEEISTLLGISVSTSKSQYHRARRRLKDLLAEENNHQAAH